MLHRLIQTTLHEPLAGLETVALYNWLKTALVKGFGFKRLRGSNLSGASLAEVNLSRADLRGTDLSDAFLTGANLTGANMSGAN